MVPWIPGTNRAVVAHSPEHRDVTSREPSTAAIHWSPWRAADRTCSHRSAAGFYDRSHQLPRGT
jgi:hypothetical protein